MKKYISILVILLLVSLTFAIQGEEPEEVPEGDEGEAGAIGPEHGVLHALDRVADNIAAFLARIGGEETHANAVRRIVAERRAEHLRLLRLKKEGKITSQEFAKMVSSLQKQIGKKEEVLAKSEQKIAEKKAGKASGGKPTSPGKSAGKGKG